MRAKTNTLTTDRTYEQTFLPSFIRRPFRFPRPTESIRERRQPTILLTQFAHLFE